MFHDKIFEKKAKISVLGDSISTYEGYHPYSYYVFYREDVIYDSGLRGVGDTWWMQVIRALGGELCVNDSFSGSTVTGGFFPSACSDERCSALGGEEPPNLILIYMGTNDRGLGVPLGEEDLSDPSCFCGAYRLMLQKLKRNYPSAQIVCATLPDGMREGEGECPPQDPLYNAAIKAAAKREGCLVADIASFAERYPSMDGCHPTKEGHDTLARLWLRALGAL